MFKHLAKSLTLFRGPRMNSFRFRQIQNPNTLSNSLRYGFSFTRKLQEFNYIESKALGNYDEIISEFTLNNLEELELPQLTKVLVIISHYLEREKEGDIKYKAQTNAGINVFLNKMELSSKIEDFFEIFASNYKLMTYKLVQTQIQTIWDERKDEMDFLNLNDSLKILYLSQIPNLVKEENEQGSRPSLELVYEIFNKNAKRYIEEMPNLPPSLNVYLCVLLKSILKYASDQEITLSSELSEIIEVVSLKTINQINSYTSQQLLKVIYHISFFSAQQNFSEICNLFEDQLMQTDLEQRKLSPADLADIGNEVTSVSVKEWLDLCINSYNEGRSNIRLFQYVQEILQSTPVEQFAHKPISFLLPSFVFILSKLEVLDSNLLSQLKNFFIEQTPELNILQLAQIYFAFSQLQMMDDDVFGNFIYFVEQNRLEGNSLGILFFSLASQKEQDQYYHQMIEYLSEDKIISVLETEDDSCDQQFILSFLYFGIRCNQMSSDIYEVFIFQKLKEYILEHPSEGNTLYINAIKILRENPLVSKSELCKDSQEYLLSYFQLNQEEFDPQICQYISESLKLIGIDH